MTIPIATRSIPLANLDGAVDAGPTLFIWSGTGGTLTVELLNDPVGTTTTFNTAASDLLPISARIATVFPSGAIGLA